VLGEAVVEQFEQDRHTEYRRWDKRAVIDIFGRGVWALAINESHAVSKLAE
jgi:hypothetical protein